MAAEGLALAASFAGLLSLGFQVTGGVVKYLDALRSRDEELAFIRQHNNVLTTTLSAIETASSSFQSQIPELTAAVTQNVQLCKKELSSVDALRAELADYQNNTWTGRLTKKKKELAYAFHQSKIQQLVQRLQQANEALQLTLTGLGLEMSKLTTAKLNEIASASQDHASELRFVDSKVAAVEVPVITILNELPILQHNVHTTADLVVSNSEVIIHRIQGSHYAIQQEFQRSQDSIQIQFSQQQEALERLEKLVRNLRQQDEQISYGTIARRAASKPAVLKELCDGIQGPTQSHCQSYDPHVSVYHPRGKDKVLVQDLQFGSVIGKTCICRRSHRSLAKRRIQWKHLHLSSECESRGHWPSCPLSKSSRTHRQTVELAYKGLAHVLKSAISLSFSWTSGAGGFSFNPNIRYYPVVDCRLDPAFRLLNLIKDCYRVVESKSKWTFMNACLRRLVRLFDDRRANPAAITQRNQTLMHFAVQLLDLPQKFDEETQMMKATSLDLIRTLLLYDVPSFTYDSEACSPLLLLGLLDISITQDALNALVEINVSDQSAASGEPSIDHNYYSAKNLAINPILHYDLSPGFAEACYCSPLSMAVVHNNVHEAAQILEQFPTSIYELDLHGNSPVHLAAAKPLMLNLLAKAADLDLLNYRNRYGFTAVETAMLLSSRQCVNGSTPKRCRDCACTQSMEILLNSGCNLRMHRIEESSNFNHRSPLLCEFLKDASELARRRYVFHMKEICTPRLQQLSSGQRRFSSRNRTDPVWNTTTTSPSISQLPGKPHLNIGEREKKDWGWIYQELESDLRLSELFNRHGFRPDPTFFVDIPEFPFYQRLDPDFICWMVDHGADLYLTSSAGPSETREAPNVGPFGAHFAFYASAHLWPKIELAVLNDLIEGVERHRLTDGCECHCSRGGCSPFLWMLKGMPRRCTPLEFAQDMKRYYSGCGSAIVMLTFAAAIRYITFDALDLVHTCRDPYDFIWGGVREWSKRDDADIINEEQASLLTLHERLVAEFEKEALKFLEHGTDGRSLFSSFWSSFWLVRMEEELRKLDGNELTLTERQGAEAIGVQWCETIGKEEEKGKIPYWWTTMEYYWHKLDSVCPEYKEADE